MPRLKDENGVQQPESLFIGDLRELTTAYEAGVAALFRSALSENTALRRQLLAAGLDPLSPASSGCTWALAVPPRLVTPISQDFRADDDSPTDCFTPLGGKRRSRGRRSRGDANSEGIGPESFFDAGSEYLSAGNEATCHEDSDCRRKSVSRPSHRFMTYEGSLHASNSMDSDAIPRTSAAYERRSLAWFVKSSAFEAFISVVIILNCMTEGLWAQNVSTGTLGSGLVAAVGVAEHIFIAIFTLEVLLKVKALGWRAFKPVDMAGRSNFVDVLLVLVTGIVPTWLVPSLAWIFRFDGKASVFKTLSVLRTVRLARLVRVFQRLPLFREAWLLVHGLSDSYRTLFWTCMVVFLVTYAFAILGLDTLVVELQSELAVATDPQDVQTIIGLLQIMSGVDQMMFCLVQVLVADSYHAFVRPMAKYLNWSWLYWYAYVAIACIVLMNLVTAIIVENAMETSRENHDHMVTEREAKRQRDIDRMYKLFKSMDADGGGTLSWDEFSLSFDDPDLGKIWKVLDIERKEARAIFQLLDDGDGEITINEFIEAVHQMSGVAQAKDMYKLQKMVALIMDALDAANARARYKVQAKGGTRGIEFTAAAAATAQGR